MPHSTSASSPDPCTPNTPALVQRAQRGDTAAFRALYECYARALFTFLLGYTADESLAEELVNDTFMRVWRALGRYHEKGQFRSWLFKIARNLAADQHRRRQHRVTEILLTEEHLEALSSPADSLAADEAIRIARTLDEVQRALQRLRPDYRAVLLLRFIQGFSVRETAQAMNRSEGAVRVLQVRALKALRQLLNDNST